MNDRKGEWMQTFTSRQFWPIDPRPEDVDLIDIAHALSMICRYGGHSLSFYSVAEHCCHIHDFLPQEFKLWGLMHDASEAYVADVPRPLKTYLTGYKAAERIVMDAICQKFLMEFREPDEVKSADNRILSDEQSQVMGYPPSPWAYLGEPLGVKVEFWQPGKARHEFLKRAYHLGLG